MSKITVNNLSENELLALVKNCIETESFFRIFCNLKKSTTDNIVSFHGYCPFPEHLNHTYPSGYLFLYVQKDAFKKIYAFEVSDIDTLLNNIKEILDNLYVFEQQYIVTYGGHIYDF